MNNDLPPKILIETRLWNQLANLIGDIGRCHPSYKDSDIGEDLQILGTAIRSCVPSRHNLPGQGDTLGSYGQLKLDRAEAVIQKHGGCYVASTPVGRCIEMAEKLLGCWSPGQLACKGLDPEQWAQLFPDTAYPI